MTDPPTDLSRCGAVVWLDDLSRERLTTGSLAGRDQAARVTANSSIFTTVIPRSAAYRPQVRDLAARRASRARLSQQLAAFLRQPPRQERSWA